MAARRPKWFESPDKYGAVVGVLLDPDPDGHYAHLQVWTRGGAKTQMTVLVHEAEAIAERLVTKVEKSVGAS